jgi:hypothetical protein
MKELIRTRKNNVHDKEVLQRVKMKHRSAVSFCASMSKKKPVLFCAEYELILYRVMAYRYHSPYVKR